MMYTELTLYRYKYIEDRTIGMVKIPGLKRIYTEEQVVRGRTEKGKLIEIEGNTALPAGVYDIRAISDTEFTGSNILQVYNKNYKANVRGCHQHYHDTFAIKLGMNIHNDDLYKPVDEIVYRIIYNRLAEGEVKLVIINGDDTFSELKQENMFNPV